MYVCIYVHTHTHTHTHTTTCGTPHHSRQRRNLQTCTFHSNVNIDVKNPKNAKIRTHTTYVWRELYVGSRHPIEDIVRQHIVKRQHGLRTIVSH
jgi:hypothetical protein